MAAASKTFETPSSSCWFETMPVETSTAFARLDASISTGSVSSWKNTNPAKSATPICMSSGPKIDSEEFKNMPMMNTKYQALPPTWATGTKVERHPRGV